MTAHKERWHDVFVLSAAHTKRDLRKQANQARRAYEAIKTKGTPYANALLGLAELYECTADFYDESLANYHLAITTREGQPEDTTPPRGQDEERDK